MDIFDKGSYRLDLKPCKAIVHKAQDFMINRYLYQISMAAVWVCMSFLLYEVSRWNCFVCMVISASALSLIHFCMGKTFRSADYVLPDNMDRAISIISEMPSDILFFYKGYKQDDSFSSKEMKENFLNKIKNGLYIRDEYLSLMEKYLAVNKSNIVFTDADIKNLAFVEKKIQTYCWWAMEYGNVRNEFTLNELKWFNQFFKLAGGSTKITNKAAFDKVCSLQPFDKEAENYSDQKCHLFDLFNQGQFVPQDNLSKKITRVVMSLMNDGYTVDESLISLMDNYLFLSQQIEIHTSKWDIIFKKRYANAYKAINRIFNRIHHDLRGLPVNSGYENIMRILVCGSEKGHEEDGKSVMNTKIVSELKTFAETI